MPGAGFQNMGFCMWLHAVGDSLIKLGKTAESFALPSII